LSHSSAVKAFVFEITYGNLHYPWQDKAPASRGSGPSMYEGPGSPVTSLYLF